MPKLFLVFLFVFLSCGDDQDRFEKIDRLRILGVQKTPAIAQAGDTSVQLTYLVATPDKTNAVAAINQPDPEAIFSQDINLSGISSTKSTYAGIDVYEVTATATFPPVFLLPRGTRAEERYRMGINVSQNSVEVQGVNDLLRFPNNAEELQLNNNMPSIQIVQPTSGASFKAGSEIDLEATITDANDEGFRISWYTTAGKIENFRGAETIIDTSDEKASSNHTVIACVRGLKTKSTVCQFHDIILN